MANQSLCAFYGSMATTLRGISNRLPMDPEQEKEKLMKLLKTWENDSRADVLFALISQSVTTFPNEILADYIGEIADIYESMWEDELNR